ncbi:MAG TPA: maleylpyruvate isomerase family mycothiol-dependent enzyme [Acidimicrobiales bacterium]|nr:maleylpyruvate isomerase family mycothiol-dependent enzyme [Acidimicrobiales bacterium]
MPSPHRQPIAVLRHSHEHLCALVSPLDDAALEAPSYCDDWNVAQVLSHLGSGAEIALLNFTAARAGAPAPDRSEYQAIWDTWNARSPREMADGFAAADEAHIAAYEALSDEELDALSIPWFDGSMLDASGAVLMRLGEHAVHTWDVEVASAPEATVQAEAVEHLVDLLPRRAARLARGDKPDGAVAVHAEEPARDFLLSLGEQPALTPGAGEAESSLSLPAEALLRLLYGRLDAEHTPSSATTSGPVDLAALRAAFPGF